MILHDLQLAVLEYRRKTGKNPAVIKLHATTYKDLKSECENFLQYEDSDGVGDSIMGIKIEVTQ